MYFAFQWLFARKQKLSFTIVEGGCKASKNINYPFVKMDNFNSHFFNNNQKVIICFCSLNSTESLLITIFFVYTVLRFHTNNQPELILTDCQYICLFLLFNLLSQYSLGLFNVCVYVKQKITHLFQPSCNNSFFRKATETTTPFGQNETKKAISAIKIALSS